jgi:DNA-binding transcriptional regulator YbjK
VQSTETYYFRDLDERASLSSALHAAWRIAEAALSSPDADVRHSGAVLDAALRDLAQYLHGAFLGGRRTEPPAAPEVFERYTADHRRGRTAD